MDEHDVEHLLSPMHFDQYATVQFIELDFVSMFTR